MENIRYSVTHDVPVDKDVAEEIARDVLHFVLDECYMSVNLDVAPGEFKDVSHAIGNIAAEYVEKVKERS